MDRFCPRQFQFDVFAQLLFDDFPHRVSGDGRYDFEPFRVLASGHSFFFQERDEIFQDKAFPGLRNHVGAHAFTQLLIGHAHHHRLEDLVVGEKVVFHLLSADVVATRMMMSLLRS